jgi:hypothetical protein
MFLGPYNHEKSPYIQHLILLQVRLRYQHINETSITNEVMDDAEIVLVPMNEESHEGQIVLRHLDHRGWYIVCGEALKRVIFSLFYIQTPFFGILFNNATFLHLMLL